MQINRLKIHFFKNYKEAEFEFHPKVNIFTGHNGAGKTNVLDAIYYLSFTKSYFNPSDQGNIRSESEYFLISGDYLNEVDSYDNLSCAFKAGERKRFKVNGKEYGRMADHVGLYPLVIITPLDSNLIYGGAEERRRYIDSVISQFDRKYLEVLLEYNKTMQQRNAFLKYLMENRRADAMQLDIWDQRLAAAGNEIYKKRKDFLEAFMPLVKEFYDFITRNNEPVHLHYRTQLDEAPLETHLAQQRSKDQLAGHTTVGIHRDDVEFTINDLQAKKYASQGQQKSFVVALKLAQFAYMKAKKGYKPLLLLDDIFDKLDIQRIEQLMKLVSRNEFGQLFITDTNKERVQHIFNEIGVEPRIFEN
jgi:DNA replication and repair protein RecF